jgi:hypothetical protein
MLEAQIADRRHDRQHGDREGEHPAAGWTKGAGYKDASAEREKQGGRSKASYVDTRPGRRLDRR